MHLTDAFIQSALQCIQAIHCFVSIRVPWELNPQPFALLTQCSTTEPQEQYNNYNVNTFFRTQKITKQKQICQKKYYFQTLCLKFPVLGGGSFKACQELAMIG